ncbi:6-bladed beta-propeller [Algoriphagus sp.]|uniref:6-bladed beta-propeller n=1 Tax=Algoriphagus sp. TaxID=1872435 RepID=UPI002637961B|nr:6-bladed beta-propeller [Algoriphagus sp.]
MKFRLLVIAILFGCSVNEKGGIKPNQATVTLINLDQTFTKDFLDLYNLSDLIELKNSEDIFLTNIFRLQVFDKDLYAFDDSFSILVRYNSNGKILNRIGKIGNGPEEVPQISDFSIDEDGIIHLASGNSFKVHRYSTKGDYLGNTTIGEQMDQISILKGKYFASLTYFNRFNKNLGIFNSNGDSLKTFFPFKDVFPIGLTKISGHLTRNSSGKILFNEPASSIIFEISDLLQMKPKYQFISNNSLWPESKRHDLNDYFEKLASAEITHLSRFYEETESHFFFSINMKKTGIRKYIIDPRFGFLDKATNKVYLSNKEDFMVFFRGPYAANGNSFYLIIPKFELNKIAKENNRWSQELNEYSLKLNAQEEMDSPIILKFQVRDLED